MEFMVNFFVFLFKGFIEPIYQWGKERFGTKPTTGRPHKIETAAEAERLVLKAVPKKRKEEPISQATFASSRNVRRYRLDNNDDITSTNLIATGLTFGLFD